MHLEPIVLRGTLHETIWGGQLLATVAGKELPPGAVVGESWETSLHSIATNSPYTGKSLGTITEELGVRLYGTRAQSIFGDRFPLLAKFLDAQDWLSVQDHPDDTYAQEHEGGKLGKTEAWRILFAAPDAKIIHGLNRPSTREEIAQAINDVTLENLTYKMSVVAEDVILNHAGTIHATGKGIVLYEIQEYSDVTYRLYDYGRVDAQGQGRELHIERGLDVLNYRPLTQHIQMPFPVDMNETVRVVCRHFAMSEITVIPAATLARTTDGTSCHIITVIAGAADLYWEGSQNEAPYHLPLGQTVVIPAEATAYRLVGEATALLSWVPDETDPRIQGWQAMQ